MAADQNLRNGALAVALVATVGLIAGIVTVSRPEADLSHVVVPFGDAGKPVGARCLAVTVRASSEALALYGLSADGGSAYAHVVVAAVPSEVGGPALPSGFDSVESTEREVPCEAPAGALEARIGSLAGFDCACGPGIEETITDIQGQTTTRPWQPGTVPRAGTWRAMGIGAWSRHPCVVFAGFPQPIPPECQ